tara:strand:+ start:2664 stop:3101 length:438 start_codon:yes stop_codon:yes gene_type:complete
MRKIENLTRFILVPTVMLGKQHYSVIENIVKNTFEKEYLPNKGYISRIKDILKIYDGDVINEGVKYKVEFSVELYFYEQGEILDCTIDNITNVGIFCQDPNMPDVGQIFIPKEGVKTEVEGRIRVKIDGVRITDNKLIAVGLITL